MAKPTNWIFNPTGRPALPRVARDILVLAFSDSGPLIVDVVQDAEGAPVLSGVSVFKDKAELIQTLTAYIPKTLGFQMLDFCFAVAEYNAMDGKSF